VANIFTCCELYVERQNMDRFTMLAESDFKIRELMQKGAAPRSHEPGKKHFTDTRRRLEARGRASVRPSSTETQVAF